MPYVMVPVPEEHEEEFTKELLAIGMRAAASAWNEAAVRSLMDGLGPVDVALVRAAAAPDRQVDRLEAGELAESLGVDIVAVTAAVERVNRTSAGLGRGWVILTSPSTRPGHGGSPVLHLPEKAAALVRRLYR